MATTLTAVYVKDVQDLGIRKFPGESSPFYVLRQKVIVASNSDPNYSPVCIELFFNNRKDLIFYLEALKALDPSNCEVCT